MWLLFTGLHVGYKLQSHRVRKTRNEFNDIKEVVIKLQNVIGRHCRLMIMFAMPSTSDLV